MIGAKIDEDNRRMQMISRMIRKWLPDDEDTQEMMIRLAQLPQIGRSVANLGCKLSTRCEPREREV